MLSHDEIGVGVYRIPALTFKRSTVSSRRSMRFKWSRESRFSVRSNLFLISDSTPPIRFSTPSNPLVVILAKSSILIFFFTLALNRISCKNCR